MTQGEHDRSADEREKDLERREAEADGRDVVADTRDHDADRQAFLGNDSAADYGARLPLRRHAATDRGNAKFDRAHSAEDREKLTE